MFKEDTEYYLIAKTEEEQIKALLILEEQGFKWNDGDAPTAFVPSRSRWAHSADVLYIHPDENQITYGHQENVPENKVEIKLNDLKVKVLL